MIDALTRRRKGYLRNGIVKVLPIKRNSDWLPDNADSAFMNTGAKIEYVTPRDRGGQLVDPLADLTDEQKQFLARQLGLQEGADLNVMKEGKKNYWINKAVQLDKNGKHLNLESPSEFVLYKILEVNLESIAPSWEERYDKGTYKFALVFADEESKMKNMRIDIKKDAYMMFGKIDGSPKKLSDFLWIYYLTNKEAKRLPNNPSMEYMRGEVGRIIEDKPGEFLAIVSDPLFDTKALIQKAINIALISREGNTFKVFGEESSKNTLDGLIEYLKDERNNNIRISLIGKIEAAELQPERIVTTESEKEMVKIQPSTASFEERMKLIEEATKKTIEENTELRIKNEDLIKQIESLKKEPAKKGPVKGKKDESKT